MIRRHPALSGLAAVALFALVAVPLVTGGCGDSGDSGTSSAGDTSASDAGTTDTAAGTTDEPATCDGLDESQRPCCADTCGDDWCSETLCSNGRWVCPWPKKDIGDAFNGGECSNACSSTPAEGMLCSVDGWVCDTELAGVWESCPTERKTVCYSCSGWDASDADPCNCACESGVVKCGGP